MNPRTLFAADLHLSPERPETARAFLDFLSTAASQAEALYILGDMFEAWAGDDDRDAPFHREIAQALADLAAGGVAVYLMHGNRDFLMGQEWARACAARLLPGPVLVDLYGKPTLLMHGDELCTDDTAYFAFRDKVRDPAWQAAFLAQPLAARKAAIQGWLNESSQEKRQKTATVMDANPQTLAEALRAHGYPRLIHGHTHRPARHLHRVDGRECERWVLPAWYGRGGYLACDEHGCQAVNF
ncbi:MAG: UDP-2,3-diacylglucosamine diphosphatase [Pseudomonadota bacterium]